MGFRVPTPADVEKSFPYLARLADHLLEHRAVSGSALIVPFIGAGASISAGLPNSGELQSQIYDELVRQPGSDALAQFLDEEARALFPTEAKNGLLRLSLFEFAAIISRFAYARRALLQVIRSVMAKATHRPLAYELLAHLAKHGHVDHFVSLNFDELLDDSLRDELPDRLRFISSRDDLPGPRFARETKPNVCYLFKPFGTLATDNYKIEVEDVRQYGSETVWKFMLESVFRPVAGNILPDIVLILVGYAAAEPAFGQLMKELLEEGQRRVSVFVVDPRDTLPQSLESLQGRDNFEAFHISIDADTAFDLLLRIMEIKYLAGHPYRIWIPTARHRIVSSLPYRSITDHELRFRLELILQAIKSRGFFTIEAVAEIERIRKYSHRACEVLQRMCDARSIVPQASAPVGTPGLRQVYLLKNYDLEVMSQNLLSEYSLRSADPIIEWKIQTDGGRSYTAVAETISHEEFLARRFKEIAGAPEIEVSTAASPSTRWLFKNAKLLNSVTRLTEETAVLFNAAIQGASVSSEPVEVYGVWTTGEWLFHDDGWAWKRIGQDLLSLMTSKRLKLSMILARNPIGKTERLNRREIVMQRLSEPIKEGYCSIRYLNWWQQNRVLSLLYWHTEAGAREARGIYMRRRLATPLVAPFLVDGADCEVLKAIFDSYQAKSQVAPDTI